MNRYAYVLNNPLSFLDPAGLWATQPVQCGTDDSGNPIYCMSAGNGDCYNSDVCLNSGYSGGLVWYCGEYGGCGQTGPNPQPPQNPAPSKSYFAKVKCNVQGELSIARQDGVALGLDVAGFIPGESTASALAQYGIATVSLFNSAIHGDGGGVKLAAGGEVVALTAAVQSTMNPATWAKAIPYVGYIANTAALLSDLTSAYAHGSQAYSACINAPD